MHRMPGLADRPGWASAAHDEALAAFLTTADALPGEAWAKVRHRARAASDARIFFETALRPSAPVRASFTGYYEPELVGSRLPSDGFTVPVHALPASSVTLTRREIETTGTHAGSEICWLRDPLDAFFLQVQGSGRIALTDGTRLRVNVAGTNGRPYTSVGKVLVARGAIAADAISAQAIRDWASTHPDDVGPLLWLNESYVFFRDVTAIAGDGGPLGALGKPVTALRSIAVDPAHIPLGAPVWVEAEGPDPVCGLMIAQDTGAAIKGAGRADIFFGTGAVAGARAGRMRAKGRLTVLLPAVDLQ